MKLFDTISDTLSNVPGAVYKTAAALYTLGGAAYGLMVAQNQGMNGGKSAETVIFSTLGAYIVPAVLGFLGAQAGRLCGALVGNVSTVGYRMVTSQAGQRLESFRESAENTGMAIGLAAGLTAAALTYAPMMSEISQSIHEHEGKARTSRAYHVGQTPSQVSDSSKTAHYTLVAA